MKYRIAKKILFSEHWHKRWKAMRPMYFDEAKGKWVQPSFHDIPVRIYQKAHNRYWGYWRHVDNGKSK